MHSMNKMHKKTQIDIAVKQLSNLQLQMDSKQTDLNELTSTEQKEVDQLKVELLDEENALKQSIKEIAEMDEALLRIGEQFEELQEKIKQRNEEKNAKAEMGDSSLEQYEVEKKSEPQNVSMDNRGNCSTQMLHFGTAVQKDRKMKNIELNSCDKSQLMRDSEMNNYPNEEYDIDFPTTISTFADPSNQDEDHSNDNNTVSQSNSFMDRSKISVSDSEYIISIPSYVLRGAGKQTHFEYEIRITLPGEKWIIMRRYSRFRELHITMKTMYGEKVHQIPFPSRELFASKSESVARNRRRQLESYLRRLIVVCSKIPQCPFYEGSNGYGLNKKTLVEFSNFFKKGLFESGRHGTG
ncbi:kinesin-like protein Klp98A [Sitodiplosis mosellana]|uniref:kinesin-like protein Klp98A n=1 Tax=Sitodiplosis mosellana TaxID=263140 RepID=UPI002443BF4F|nr:kinesin-like protein Klp98A [Sitodiplosis mosellana]